MMDISGSKQIHWVGFKFVNLHSPSVDCGAWNQFYTFIFLFWSFMTGNTKGAQ